MKYILLLCTTLLLVGCSTPKRTVQQKPRGLEYTFMQVVSSELIETNGMKRMVTIMSDGSIRIYPED